MKKIIVSLLLCVGLLATACVNDDPIADQWTHNLYPDSNGSYTIGSNGSVYSEGHFTNLYATTLYLAGAIINGTTTATTGNFTNINVTNNATTNDLYARLTAGAELAPAVSAANYTGTNWVFAGSTAEHTASDTNTLYPTVAIVPVIGTQYRVTYTISGWTAGTDVMTFGGVVGVARQGNQNVNVYVTPYTTGNLIFTPSADFRGKISNVSVTVITSGTVYIDRNIWMYDDRGVLTSTSALYAHLSELSSNTLLDRSRSTLTCTGGVLTYTLYAMDGSGTWNFNGIVYPAAVASASIPLIAGTNLSPATNYVYFELQANVPTLVASTTEPTGLHIDIATWIVGAVSGTNYTIYGYNRNRQEIDTFISRTIERIEDSGTLYVNGMFPTVNSTALSVLGGGKFYNGIFPMTTANNVSMANGFCYINSSGKFVQATSIASLNQYANGVVLGNNERQNIVWGIVPISTAAGGAIPVNVRLIAVLQSEPTSVYISDSTARQDVYDATNYYPPNDELKKVFVPICRTIVHPNTNTFKTFDTGLYLKDIRGKITSGGGAAASTDVSGLVPYTGAVADLTYGGATLRLDGSFAPASMSNASAVNNSIYFSTDNNKLVFKDSVGVVNELY